MLDVVTKHNANLYSEALQQMFKLRHALLVEERGWEDLRKTDGLERDQFDGPDATYLLAMHEDMVIGSVRMMPTAGPHLLSDVFPHLVADSMVPRADDIWEMTRICVQKEFRYSRTRTPVIADLTAGMFEHALNLGLRAVTAVIEPFMVTRMLKSNWKVKPLGLPQEHNGMDCIAVSIQIERETMDGIRLRHGLPDPLLNYVGIARPAPLPQEMPVKVPLRLH
jgi:acyl-homoserine lactone synthase